MLECSSEENTAGNQPKNMRKLAVAISPQTHVLQQSNRHNLQSSISSHGASFAKGKSTSKKANMIRPLKEVVDIHAKQSAVSFGRHMEEGLELCSASKAIAEVKDSTNSSEVNVLKQRLQAADLQIAEVVAQSAILVRDVECAASKKIGDALRHVQAGEVKTSSALLRNTQKKMGFDHVGVGTLEQELAVTRQELADCKCMLAVMRRQLDQTSREKEKLEIYLRSSVETSLKLEKTLANQKAVMQLELLAAEDRCRNESAGLFQSARNEAKHLQEQLEEARLSKAESDCLLRDCIQLLCHAQREQCKAQNKQQCCSQSAVQEKYQQLQIAQEQVQLQRESLHEAATENAIIWTVLKCIWEGAVQFPPKSRSFFLNQNMRVETPKFLDKNSKEPSSHVQKCFFCSSKEDPTPNPTPVKSRIVFETPRSTNRVGDGQRRPMVQLSCPEDVLRKNLIKSEQEVGFLGDKVDELRIILEKVTLLLDCISKSSVTGHETRVLMRRIIEQLQTFEM